MCVEGGSGQQLTDNAVAGLAKALGRRQKKVAKQKKGDMPREADTSSAANAAGQISPFAAKNKAAKPKATDNRPGDTNIEGSNNGDIGSNMQSAKEGPAGRGIKASRKEKKGRTGKKSTNLLGTNP